MKQIFQRLRDCFECCSIVEKDVCFAFMWDDENGVYSGQFEVWNGEGIGNVNKFQIKFRNGCKVFLRMVDKISVSKI